MRYSTVLTYLYSGQEWSLSDENYDTLNWFSDTQAKLAAILV
jgi:hypothetical protein